MTRFLLLASLALAACSSGGKASLPAAGDPQQTAIGVRVIKPSTSMDESLRRATGELRAHNTAVLGAPATGTIEKFLVDVGDRVKEGQELMRLDASNARITVDQAQAAVASAEAAGTATRLELERAQALHASGAVAQAGLDRAQAAETQAAAAVAQATAGLRAAQEVLRDQVLRAPFAGVITQRLKNVGESVTLTPSTSVLGLAQVENLETRLQVPEAVIADLAAGNTLKGTTSPAGIAFQAKVRSVGAVVDPATRTVEVLADVVPPLDPGLRAGTLVEVQLPGSELGGLFLPARAVVREGNALHVWVVEQDAARRRPVQGAQLSPGVVRVEQGLGPDDLVIADGTAALTDGLHVQVVQ